MFARWPCVSSRSPFNCVCWRSLDRRNLFKRPRGYLFVIGPLDHRAFISIWQYERCIILGATKGVSSRFFLVIWPQGRYFLCFTKRRITRYLTAWFMIQFSKGRWRMVITVNVSSFSNWREEAWKNHSTAGFEPVTSVNTRVMLYQLSYEVHDLPHVKDVKYTWNNSYLYCGCRWKWRIIIAVNFSNLSNWREEAWKTNH